MCWDKIISIVMTYSYLLYVVAFGVATTFYLWIRDARIFYRTGLEGYRKAAYQGVLYTALAMMGIVFSLQGLDLIAMGIVLLALYLQGRVKREVVWKKSSTAADRFLGRA